LKGVAGGVVAITRSRSSVAGRSSTRSRSSIFGGSITMCRCAVKTSFCLFIKGLTLIFIHGNHSGQSLGHYISFDRESTSRLLLDTIDDTTSARLDKEHNGLQDFVTKKFSSITQLHQLSDSGMSVAPKASRVCKSGHINKWIASGCPSLVSFLGKCSSDGL